MVSAGKTTPDPFSSPLDDPDVGLEVDPGKLYYQEQQQWSKAASNHLFIDTNNP